uniref:Putative product n=1 Tax=Xenopsylla cheopis TaxID=163159 RepID=A0A6M2DKT9_XENCH
MILIDSFMEWCLIIMSERSSAAIYNDICLQQSIALILAPTTQSTFSQLPCDLPVLLNAKSIASMAFPCCNVKSYLLISIFSININTFFQQCLDNFCVTFIYSLRV